MLISSESDASDLDEGERRILFSSIARHCGCWCDETAIGVMHVAVRRHALRGRLFSRRLETKSLADITAAVLQEGSSVVAKPGTIPGPSLETLQELTKAMPPQPVSVLMLSSWAKITKGNDAKALQGRLMQARFVRSELIARRAHILSLLHSMPEPLAGQPAVAGLGGVYWDRLRELLEWPEITTHEEERAFATLCKDRNDQMTRFSCLRVDTSGLGAIDEEGTMSEESMCVNALASMQRERGAEWWATHPEERLAVDRQLDAIFLARIGLRFLLEFHVACETPVEGFSGVLEMRCSPVAACQDVALEVQAALSDEYGDAPRIEVVGDSSQTFTFVPSHIRYVVGTLLKNSSVATLRHHHRLQAAGKLEPGTPLPPVKAIVAVSDEVVQLKLEDQAGGIKRSSLINVWSYRALESKWWKPADGLSLPLARLFCVYFGGDMTLVPVEGYGTDCYITFNRLAHANSEYILPPGDADGLFNAQSRRLPGDPQIT